MKHFGRALASFFATMTLLYGASPQADEVDRLYAETARDGRAYADLRELCTLAPRRFVGTENLRQAVDWAASKLREVPGAQVRLQEVLIPGWRREKAATAELVGLASEAPLSVLALGFCAGTPGQGLEAEVVEVKSLAEVEKLGRAGVSGKIVFFNRPMDLEETRRGDGYGRTVDQRSKGPQVAARYGAVAALVRSVTIASDDVPHTGITHFEDNKDAIPAAALGIQSAERLSRALAKTPGLHVKLSLGASFLPDHIDYNVIAEIPGTVRPDEIILVGGHIDSWDNTVGAHDNGAGVVQSMEAFRLLAERGVPRHTLRCVLFSGEETGAWGGLAYAKQAAAAGEKHVFAVETDAGGFPAVGVQFGEKPLGDKSAVFSKAWASLLTPYGVSHYESGHGGTDVGPLQAQGTVTAYLMTDPVRYFMIHHAATDTFDKVDKAELAQGAGTIAAMLWLVDNEGLPTASPASLAARRSSPSLACFDCVALSK